MTRRRKRASRGAAAVELALLLSFLFLIAAAFGPLGLARMYRRAEAVEECATAAANAGVMLGSAATPAEREAAMNSAADAAIAAAGLSPDPTVDCSVGTDDMGFGYAEATVTHAGTDQDGELWQYSSSSITRTVRMMLPP